MRTVMMVLAATCVVVIASGAAQERQDGSGYQPVTTYDPQRNAEHDLADAVAEAARTGKHVLVDVGGEWCVWCHRLDRFIEDHKEISKLLHQEYVLVKVNWSKENKNEVVLSKYPTISGYPHIFILDMEGKLLHSQDTSELEEGKSYNVQKMSAFLKRWGPPKKG
jgi:thiol:disulfide interchange protein